MNPAGYTNGFLVARRCRRVLLLLVTLGTTLLTPCSLRILASSAASSPYVWTTVAGLAGTTGTVDGTNSNARFLRPTGIARDLSGNLYVTDRNAVRQIKHVGNDWVVTTIAGLVGTNTFGSADGTNSDARFNIPYGLTVDAAGVIYVADGGNHIIRRVAPVGTNWVVTTIAGTAGVCDSTDGVNEHARFCWPWDIKVGSDQNLYVANGTYAGIRKITPVGPNWVVSTVDFTNDVIPLNMAFSVALGHDGKLYVPDSNNNGVREFIPTGTNWFLKTLAGGLGRGSADGTNSAAKFNSPVGITADPEGTLFVADGAALIRRVAPLGTNWIVTTIGGRAGYSHSVDGVGTNAFLNYPFHITVDDSGNLYTTDYESVRIGSPLSLDLTVVGNQAVVSWPALATNFVLESSGRLDPNASWTPLTNNVVITTVKCFRTNDIETGATFYRLRKQ